MAFPRNDVCPVCTSPAFKDTDDVVLGFSCVRCGDFRIHEIAWKPGSLSDDQLVRISGWIREQNFAQVTPIITQEIFRKILVRSRPRMFDRAISVLKIFSHHYPSLEEYVSFDENGAPELEMLGTSFSRNLEDLKVLVELLVNAGWLQKRQGYYSLSITGMLKLEDMQSSGGGSAIGFVAMSFDSAMDQYWSGGFEPAIREAGFTPLRISDKEFVGGITDQIMTEIRKSRFVIADYTGQKAGVYFEAGFALGLGLTVIPTCRSDEISNLHFDIRHLNTLVWNDEKELGSKLTQRISAIVGTGPILT